MARLANRRREVCPGIEPDVGRFERAWQWPKTLGLDTHLNDKSSDMALIDMPYFKVHMLKRLSQSD